MRMFRPRVLLGIELWSGLVLGQWFAIGPLLIIAIFTTYKRHKDIIKYINMKI